MKKLSHKQLHRSLSWIFIFILLFGIGLMMLVKVETAAKQSEGNRFPVINDRVN